MTNDKARISKEVPGIECPKLRKGRSSETLKSTFKTQRRRGERDAEEVRNGASQGRTRFVVMAVPFLCLKPFAFKPWVSGEWIGSDSGVVSTHQ